MFHLETVGIAMSLLFSMRNGFPFSTYGEAVFILIQNMGILLGELLDRNHHIMTIAPAQGPTTPLLRGSGNRHLHLWARPQAADTGCRDRLGRGAYQRGGACISVGRAVR
jgi:hypothetical protein